MTVGSMGCSPAPPFPPPAPPQYVLVVEPQEVRPGDPILVTLWVLGGPLPPAATVEAWGESRPMAPVGNRLVAFLAAPLSLAPGEAQVEAVLAEGATHTDETRSGGATNTDPSGAGGATGTGSPSGAGGMPARVSAAVSVKARTVEVSHLTASPSQLDARSQEKLREDQRKVRRAKSESAPLPLWKGEFVAPLEAPVSSPFGAVRYVNGRAAGRHTGIDLAAPAGTPVAAANAGRVVFAGRLHAAGLTVIVDHGLWLFSSYSHLRALAVKTGDTVSRGQVVGWVGSTGFSTGPHLHWSVSVGLEPVDPASLTGPRPWLSSLAP